MWANRFLLHDSTPKSGCYITWVVHILSYSHLFRLTLLTKNWAVLAHSWCTINKYCIVCWMELSSIFLLVVNSMPSFKMVKLLGNWLHIVVQREISWYSQKSISNSSDPKQFLLKTQSFNKSKLWVFCCGKRHILNYGFNEGS